MNVPVVYHRDAVCQQPSVYRELYGQDARSA